MDDLLTRLKAALADRYTIERELGSGGMAIVFLAQDLKHDRSVAVKVLRPELVAFVGSLGVQRFLREISVAAKLSHPHILALHDSGEVEGLPYYVMPFVEGESLRDRLNREGPLRIEEALRIAREVASALSYAHSLGFVHRDIKPENILLHHDEPVIADFGIAAAVSEAGGGRLTETGIAVGTPLYMSPEQAAGGIDPISGKSDLYSLACVLYEMLTGQPPFTGQNAQAIMARHAIDPVPAIRTVRSTVPACVDDAVRRGLAKIPADRYETGTEFAEALVGMDQGPGRSASLLAPIKRIGGRRFLIWAVPAAVALVASYWLLETAEPSLDRHSVAVAYFADVSPNGELRAIADSLTEGIIDELSVVDQIDVVSRHGVIPYRNSELTRDSIARALNVGTVLFGSVERVGQYLRVTIRLADGRTGEDIIERRGFQLPLGATKAMQDSLIQAISGAFAYWLGEDIWALP